MSMEANTIICGDALEVLATLPACSVQCVLTSPPYYSLRDYGVAGQIGLEETPQEYISKLVAVFAEVRRVLRDDGLLWLNIGDSFSGSGKTTGRNDENPEDIARRANLYKTGTVKVASNPQARTPTACKSDLPAKNLMMIPARVAIALQDDGWILRSEIVWHKPNAMPESVTDRVTKAHEMVYMLAKSERYYSDMDAIREPHITDSNVRDRAKESHWASGALLTPIGQGIREWNHPNGRNARSVWTIATQPYKDAHFACMPPKLAERCILASTSDRCCEHCGAAWKRVTEVENKIEVPRGAQAFRNHRGIGRKGGGIDRDLPSGYVPRIKVSGYAPRCTCPDNTGAGKSIVLDPFSGAGTTALVANNLNLRYIGIELNPAYVEMSRRRLVQPSLDWTA